MVEPVRGPTRFSKRDSDRVGGRQSTLFNPIGSTAADSGHEQSCSGSAEDETQAIRDPGFPREVEHQKTCGEDKENGPDDARGDAGLSQA